MKNNNDKYTIEIRNELFCFLKNGKLHRETGPALFSFEDKEKYFMLQDKHLYTLSSDAYKNIQEISDSHIFGLTLSFMTDKSPTNIIGYYLEGKEYDKNTWYYVMKKQEITKELNEELSESEIETRQTKV